MKTFTDQALRTLFAALLMAGLWFVAPGAGAGALPQRLQPIALLGLGMAALCAMLFRRVQSEDRIAGLEAALCREQSARSQSEQALAEADLLLARITARANGNCSGDPAGQLVLIQAELTQLQQRCGPDQAIRTRLELLRTRLERLGASLRMEARAAEPG
jgi:hypothetical protein